MNILKQILTYIIWILSALLLGICYMSILLGPHKESSTRVLHLSDVLYDLALFYVGLIIGSIIAVLYIFIDIFYLKKKTEKQLKVNNCSFYCSSCYYYSCRNNTLYIRKDYRHHLKVIELKKF